MNRAVNRGAETLKCCRCRHRHTESERINIPAADGWMSSRCPRCKAETYFELSASAPPREPALTIPADGAASEPTDQDQQSNAPGGPVPAGEGAAAVDKAAHAILALMWRLDEGGTPPTRAELEEISDLLTPELKTKQL